MSAVKTDLPTIIKHLDYSFVEYNTELTETTMLLLAYVMLAILLGGAGLYLGLTVKQQLAPLTKSLDEGRSSTAHINKQLSKIDTRINELSTQNAKRKETIQRLGRESSQNLQEAKQAYVGVQSNRGELIELAQMITQFATIGAVPNALRSRVEATSSGSVISAIETFTASGSASTYKIRSADLRRLSIGKVINIPAN